MKVAWSPCWPPWWTQLSEEGWKPPGSFTHCFFFLFPSRLPMQPAGGGFLLSLPRGPSGCSGEPWQTTHSEALRAAIRTLPCFCCQEGGAGQGNQDYSPFTFEVGAIDQHLYLLSFLSPLTYTVSITGTSKDLDRDHPTFDSQEKTIEKRFISAKLLECKR